LKLYLIILQLTIIIFNKLIEKLNFIKLVFMIMNTNYQIKRKIVSDKDIIDFLTMLEDKYENNSQKLQSFVEIFNKYNNSK